MMTDEVNEHIFYVLVNLNGDVMRAPDYFIAHGHEIKPLIKQYETRGTLYITSVTNEVFLNNWNKIV